MATTSQLCTWIELECHGWQREGEKGTRALLNEAHKLLEQRQHAQKVLLDETTGNLPFVETQDRVYRYACPANVWRVGAILVDEATDIDYGTRFSETDLRLDDYTFSSVNYRRIRNVRSFDRTGRANASFQFISYNPGATTQAYRRLAWARPTEITSSSVQHDMPDGMDTKYLMPATIALIEAINDHDKFQKVLAWIATGLADQYWHERDRGEQGIGFIIEKRRF